jgi:SAM-dependent methyltransferase
MSSEEVKKFFKSRYQTYGSTFQAVQYSSLDSQYRRYEVLTERVGHMDSVVDVGCGVGHLLQFLREKKGFQGSYLGLDFLPEFVDESRLIFAADEKAQFEVFEIGKNPFPPGHDCFLLSGTFNNKRGDNAAFMLDAVKGMFEASRKLVSFNAMSTYVDYQAENLFYSDPLQVIDFCKKNVTRKLVLRHEYLVKEGSIPFEYTMYLFK